MRSRSAELLGAQEPTLEVAPRARSHAGDEAIDLAATAGLDLDPWQQHVLRRSLGEQAGGLWAAMEVGLVVPRQNGKGSILEARELAGIVLFDERKLLHSAHQFKTAAEGFERFRQLIESCDDLRRRIRKVRQSHGEEGVVLRNGGELRFVARSHSSGRGFTGDCVILDEALILEAETVAAMLPTLSSRPNPQVWYTSSAPLATSSQLHLLRRRAIAARKARRPGRLAYFEWASDETVDPDDLRALARVNPSLGRRLNRTFVLEVERPSMTDRTYKRERLGVPEPEPVVGDQLEAMPAAGWRAGVDRSATCDPTVFAVHVSDDRMVAVIALAGIRPDGRVHGEVVQFAHGTDWLLARLVELHHRWQVPVAVAAGSPAASLVPSLERMAVPVENVTAVERTAACGALVDLVTGRQFVHIEQPVLEIAVEEAVRRPVGDAWVWDQRGRRDVGPLVAVTWAAWVARRLVPTEPVDLDRDLYG
ncbi:MAG TPA: hypothetical protein PKB00_08355 [Microthrixaceae bacterium]|nr:hypothetical protein [Microthrixaceae bacterium]HMV74567.1 hypothetical protein [Microthrixaceae bacterium]